MITLLMIRQVNYLTGRHLPSKGKQAVATRLRFHPHIFSLYMANVPTPYHHDGNILSYVAEKKNTFFVLQSFLDMERPLPIAVKEVGYSSHFLRGKFHNR